MLSDLVPWLSIVLGILGVYFAWKRYARVRISFEISTFEIFSKHRAYKRPIVLLDGLLVDDPYVAEVSIRNDGNVAVAAADFVRPLSIELQPGCTIISAEVLSNRKDQKIEFSVEERSVHVSPVLLNAGDNVLFRLVVTSKPKIDLSARIKGVEELESPHSYTSFVGFAAILAGICMVAGLVVINVTSLALTEESRNLLATSLFVTSLISFQFATMSRIVRLYNAAQH